MYRVSTKTEYLHRKIEVVAHAKNARVIISYVIDVIVNCSANRIQKYVQVFGLGYSSGRSGGNTIW